MDFDAQQSLLITGGTGFVGSHLLEYALKKGAQNIHLTGMQPGLSGWFEQYVSDSRVKYHRIDLTDDSATRELIKQVQPAAIFHLASLAAVQGSFEKAKAVVLNNTLIQLALLEALRLEASQARCLVISSADVYGQSSESEIPINEEHALRPTNPYAVSKATQDLLTYQYWMSYQLPLIRVRPFNHSGARQLPFFALPAFAQQIVEIERGHQDQLLVGNLDAVRDFTDVRDIVAAYWLLAFSGQPGEIYNLGSGQGIKMQQVVDRLCSLAQVPISVVQDPSRLRPHDVPVSIADASKVQQLGWKPQFTLDQMLESVLEYYRSI